MKRMLALLLFPLFTFGQFTKDEVKRFEDHAKKVTIIRDNWDVPHIYGKTDADAVFGLMYAQCEENLEAVELNTLEMLGRLSEVHGAEELYNDLQMRLIYDTAAAIRDYQRSPAWLKKLMDASADGINYYLYRHPQQKTAVLTRFQPWYALMRTDGSISATQTGGLTLADMKALYPLKNDVSYHERSLPFYEVDPTGSNGFALAPSRTHSGNAILYINPHVTFYFRTEVHMVSDEGLNTYGAVTWSNFFVYQGFNAYCGWMHTSSYADVADLFYEKTERRGDSLFTVYDGKLLPVEQQQIRLNYKANGAQGSESFTAYRTVHGPVVGSRNGQWLSLRENNRSLDALEQSWLRTKAKGFADFRKVMNMRSNNSNNTVFADNKGNIAYWHGNFMPRRDSHFDYSLPVDGTRSATDWKGLHALDEIVHVYNPQTGWIENCNSTPFTVSGTASPKKEDFLRYMAPDGQNYRALNAVRLLQDARDMTPDRLIREIGYSHYLSAFDVLLPALLQSYDALWTGDSMRARLAEPIGYLRNWDKNSSDTSVASTLAIEWAYRMAAKASPADNPYNTTDAIAQVHSMVQNTSGAERLALLWETVTDLQKRFNTWKTGWGEVNRYQRVNYPPFSDRKWSLPVGLGAATWGSIPSFASRRFPTTNRRYGVSGNSFIACVEFGKKVSAKTIITGGQSFDPASPHYTDQAERYIRGEFKDVLFYKEDVKKHAVRTYHPGEEVTSGQ